MLHFTCWKDHCLSLLCLCILGGKSITFHRRTALQKMHVKRNKQILLVQQNRKLQKKCNTFAAAKNRKFNNAHGQRRGKGKKAHFLNAEKLLEPISDVHTSHQRYQLRDRAVTCQDAENQSFSRLRGRSKLENTSQKSLKETRHSRATCTSYCEYDANDVVYNKVKTKISSEKKDDDKWDEHSINTRRVTQLVSWSQNQIKKHTKQYRGRLRSCNIAASHRNFELNKSVSQGSVKNDIGHNEDSSTLECFPNTESLTSAVGAVDSLVVLSTNDANIADKLTSNCIPSDSKPTEATELGNEFTARCQELGKFQTRRRTRSRGSRWRNGYVKAAKRQKQAKFQRKQTWASSLTALSQETKITEMTRDDTMLTAVTKVHQIGSTDREQVCSLLALHKNVGSVLSDVCVFSEGASKVCLGKSRDNREYANESEISSVTLRSKVNSGFDRRNLDRMTSSTLVKCTPKKSASDESDISVPLHSRTVDDLNDTVVRSSRSPSLSSDSLNTRVHVESRISSIMSSMDERAASVTSVPSLCDVTDSGVFIDSSLPTISDAKPVISFSVSASWLCFQ